MATPNELQTRNFDSLLVIPSAARNNMFSLEERFEILKTYFQSQCCVAETVRILKRNMGRDRAPTEGAIRKLVRKVREKGIAQFKDRNANGPLRDLKWKIKELTLAARKLNSVGRAGVEEIRRKDEIEMQHGQRLMLGRSDKTER
ncbi:hypothetical protein G5I_06972 [Acromyrmex echinatior]|uniref:DUF4817 domain-containing protein n=1 Tax=Acromyrmex echinatior TaxID=103372 RepID=F4WMD8_ACREC|nr:hypothetical protein G5I_06972 [Acromyrmex echinatior]